MEESMKKKKCENCKWRYGVHLFECHRFPPQSIGKEVKETIFRSGMKVPEFRFPSIRNRDFCGEFKKNGRK